MWKSFSIAQKIWISMGILIMGYFVSMVIGFILGRETEDRIYNISNKLFTASIQSKRALSEFGDQIKIYNDIVMMGNIGNLLEAAQYKANEAQQALQSIIQIIGELDSQQSEDISQTYLQLKQFTDSAQILYAKIGSDPEYLFENENEDANNLENEMFQTGQEMNRLHEKLKSISQKFSDNLHAELAYVSGGIHNYRYVNMWIFFGLAIFTGFTIWLIIRHYITRPLSSTINNLSVCADDILSSSLHMSERSQSLAERSSQQASTVEEISSSLEEMSSMTRLNAHNAVQANEIVEKLIGLIKRTDKFMTDLMTSMGDISKASQETYKIVKTIDEIAFQTNLLALNAAVEAARAGSAGVGFAVVADEVRNLALRSAGAAKNTSSLIAETVEKIKEGSNITSDTIEAFKAVAKDAASMKELMAEIAAASDSQAKGTEQINVGINEMDQITQQNAATAEEGASSSIGMKERAEEMKQMVDALSVLIRGFKKGEDSETSLTVISKSKGISKYQT